MAYAKVISTTFGVTIAVVHTGSFADDLGAYNDHPEEIIPYSGSVYNLPSAEITVLDLYNIISNSEEENNEEESASLNSTVKIYRQEDGYKKALTEESMAVSSDSNDIQVFYFERQSVPYNNNDYFNPNFRNQASDFSKEYLNINGNLWDNNRDIAQGRVYDSLPSGSLRIGTLISGGPDGIIAASLLREAGRMENSPIEGYDFFYVRPGRPSDWREFESIENYLQNNFDGNYNLHVMDMSSGATRMLLCGDYENTYTRFGLSAVLSLVYAKCEKLKNKPNLILFGIHGADASFKAKESNEYTRDFVNAWNSFWKVFYHSRPFLIAPLIDVFDKIDILKMAQPLGIDIGKTWSCYKGGKYHCGQCKSCLERRLAYQMSRMPDPTRYENTPNIKQFKERIGGVSINKNEQQIQLSS